MADGGYELGPKAAVQAVPEPAAAVLWAVAIGYTVWGDVPDALAVVGMVVIAASGLFILRRQRLRAAD